MPTNADGDDGPPSERRPLSTSPASGRKKAYFFSRPTPSRKSTVKCSSSASPNELLATWEGHKYSKQEATAISGNQDREMAFGISLVFSLDHVRERARLSQFQRAPAGRRSRLNRAMPDSCATARRGTRCTSTIGLGRLMHELRAVKSPQELELIRKACADHARRVFAGGEIREAGGERGGRRGGIRATSSSGARAASPIRRSSRRGRNNCVLHYVSNDQPCKSGQLLLLDVAAGYGNYMSDLTRHYSGEAGGSPADRRKSTARSCASSAR